MFRYVRQDQYQPSLPNQWEEGVGVLLGFLSPAGVGVLPGRP